MSRALRASAVGLLALQLVACAGPKGTVVLLPEADGRDTAVVVTQGGTTVVLDKPYAGARVGSATAQKYDSSAAEVQAQFGTALAALPTRPAQFTLYFIEGRDELTDESKQIIDRVATEIAARPVPDVIVIGHTDTVGSDAVNDPLSRQRAEVVRKALLARGLAPDSVVVVGRGKRSPIVPTADGVAEARNRRVEILVR